MYARYMEHIFQLNYILPINIAQCICIPLNKMRENIKHLSQIKIAEKIDMNINRRMNITILLNIY